MSSEFHPITHGYIILCAGGILLGLTALVLGEWVTGVLLLSSSLAGLEMWTHWGTMWWRSIQRDTDG